jgi:hypothetical protein
MPPRIARHRRSGLFRRVFLSAFAWSVAPLAGQELPLLREYPGSGPYECPASVIPVLPSPDERARAGQLASDANQAMVLGDLERVEVLLSQAVGLDRTSADLVYRHARVQEDLGDVEGAMTEFCRALDLGVESIGIVDTKERLDALSEEIRARIPEAAHEWFRVGLAQADDSLFVDALVSFTAAMEAAPEWATPLHNRAIIHEYLRHVQQALADFRRYLTYLTVDPEAADAILVSQRIGLLEGAASVATPSPSGAFVLGIVPGMGHYYTGRPLAGTMTLAAAGGAAAAGLLFKNITTICLDDVPNGQACPPDMVVDEITERPYLWYGIGVAAAVTITGAIDALLKAKRRRDVTEAIAEPGEETGPRIRLPTVSTRGGRVDLNLVRVTFR